jgi:hypothetical protein
VGEEDTVNAVMFTFSLEEDEPVDVDVVTAADP